MKKQLFHSDEESKRGVALIVVLGFLSIMILMAVAFVMQARVERLVSGATLEAQRGRQMARTALNAGMSDYSSQLYGENKFMLPPEDSDFDLFVSKPPYASGEIQPSLAGENGTLSGSGIELMKGEARNWIPRRYLESEDFAMDNARWVLVRQDPSKGAGRENPVVGRYAYLCFDMSGGIDANLIALSEGVAEVGNATNRASVRDLGMRELKETADASRFKSLRRGWHGFDSLAELILLTNGRYNGGENSVAVKYNGTDYYYIDEGVSAEELPPEKMWGPPGGSGGSRWRSGEGWTRIETAANALHSTNVSDLVPYSLATFRGWEYNANTAKWKTDNLVAWDENDEWTDSDWRMALKGIDEQFEGGAIPDWWEKALKDFTSDDVYPVGTNYPSPKNVPMINEVGISITPHMPVAGTFQFQLDFDLMIEVWYPFPDPTNSITEDFSFGDFILGGGSAQAAPPGINFRIPMILECETNQTDRRPIVEWSVPLSSATANPPMPFKAKNGAPVVYTFSFSIPVQFTGADIDGSFKVRPLATQGGLQITTGGRSVDWIDGSIIDLAAAGRYLPWEETKRYWEVSDPRINHIGEAWEPGPEDGTMGEINLAATSRGYGTNGDSTNFYCRNAAMISPLDLGNFSTGNPWKTLEFCTKEGADALSRMVSRQTMDEVEDVGVAYTNGTINPNTSSSNVLRAALADLKIKDDGKALEDSELVELIGVLTDITETKTITPSTDKFRGACMRGVDWIWAEPFQADGYYGRKWSKNERHRLIGSTWGLFNPNNSMFTVLVIGQSIKEGPLQPGAWSSDDVVTGERRAVALVWRDPTPPGINKPHEMFVKMFKMLDE